MRKAEAERAGRELVERLEGKGWEVEACLCGIGLTTWWACFATKGQLQVNHAGFRDGAPVYLAMLCPLDKPTACYPDPNEAVRQTLAEARAHVAELTAAIESVEPTPQDLNSIVAANGYEGPGLESETEIEKAFREGHEWALGTRCGETEAWDKSEAKARLEKRHELARREMGNG